MDIPFFRNQWSVPSHRQYYSPSPVPVHRNPTPPPRPKIVSIPVRFVDSERTQSDSALKIQSLFRGYLVRKSVKRIAAIGREVDEVQRRVEDVVVVDLMRRDSRERLKVNETLMNLLFQLDSVRGVDSGVREYRKKVIRRAIALQEKVDGIAAAAAAAAVDRVRADEEIEESLNVQVRDEAAVTGVEDSENRSECDSMKSEAIDVEQGNASQPDEEAAEQLVEGEGGNTGGNTSAEERDHCVNAVGDDYDAIVKGGDHSTVLTVVERDISVGGGDQMAEERYHCIEAVDDDHNVHAKGGDHSTELPVVEELERGLSCDEPQTMDADLNTNGEEEEAIEETRAESETGSSLNPESLIEAIDENEVDDAANVLGASEREIGKSEERENKEGRNKELLERMVEDNEKMMALMAELFERNERQTRLLSSLSQRVEQLERAFVCEKLRKKKKRQASCGGGGGGCSETFPDSKKCGRR